MRSRDITAAAASLTSAAQESRHLWRQRQQENQDESQENTGHLVACPGNPEDEGDGETADGDEEKEQEFQLKQEFIYLYSEGGGRG